MRVNEAPPVSYPVPTLDSPEKVYDFWQEHIATAAWFSPDQECLTDGIWLRIGCGYIPNSLRLIFLL
jgi:hypothetical protein